MTFRLAPALAIFMLLLAPGLAHAQSGGGLSSKAAESQMPPKVVPGATAKLTANGKAIPPASAPPQVKAVIAAGNRISHKPYKWGGGHARLNDSGYDCSGSVSYALRGGKLMSYSLPSGPFMSWGERGRGQWITIRTNPGHIYMVVAGLRFDTSARSTTGSRWTTAKRSARGFVARHPAGL
jgi:cell wall-associated NlpC family hydrolase